MNLAEKLVCLRKEKGLSQSELAEMVNVSRQAVSRWETGAAIPSTENLKYLGVLYDVSLDYLLNDTADETERNQGIPDQPEVEPVVPDSPERGNGKKNAFKWAAIVLVLLAFIAVLCIYVFVGNRDSAVPINDLPKKEVESEVGPGFDLEW